MRIAALCLDGEDRLSNRLVCSTAVRAGLLVDLALAGRLEETAASIALDDSPTGVPRWTSCCRRCRRRRGRWTPGWSSPARRCTTWPPR